MDVSKLPRLSETKPAEPAQPPADAPVPPAPLPPPPSPASHPSDYRRDSGGIAGAEIWFSIIVGLILVLYTAHFGKFLIASATGQPYHTGVEWNTGPNEGREVPYLELEGGTFFSDSSLFLFGLALLIGGAAQFAGLVSHNRVFAWISLGFLLLATVYCAVAVAVLFQKGVTPLMSLLCVGLGGYGVFYEWSALKRA
jgi:hypothetical protein